VIRRTALIGYSIPLKEGETGSFRGILPLADLTNVNDADYDETSNDTYYAQSSVYRVSRKVYLLSLHVFILCNFLVIGNFFYAA